MAISRFHKEPYDAGTLTKLKIFELYTQEWIPVFTSSAEPPFDEVHIFDLFCGPGTDSKGVYGSPLRIMDQLRRYQRRGMPGWSKVRIFVHFSDSQQGKIDELLSTLNDASWKVPGVLVEAKTVEFQEALKIHRSVLENPRAAKLVIIDQFGVDEVTDAVFRYLITLPTTDFIFFLSSSTLHRFRDHPSIKMKIERPEDSYDVHRAAFAYFKNLAHRDVFLGRFSIRKRSNIYGLIFGSKHPLGIHKFLQVAWGNDEIAGEANFGGDLGEGCTDGGDEFLGVACFRAAQEGFDFAPHLFEGVEVRGGGGGRKRTCAPVAAMSRSVGSLLCEARLSLTTRSPGRSLGPSTSAT